MSPCDRHLDCPLHLVLTLDLGKVDVESISPVMRVRHVACHRGEFGGLGEELVGLAEIPDPIDIDSLDD